ncbi:class II aldolase/adducin domain-containing protein [Hysterangium stoloniferum]|nr:class II aldolase/adducin domain-containing protein [Hysterangium stoloniferum]
MSAQSMTSQTASAQKSQEQVPLATESSAAKFERPPLPTFATVEEKRRHVKERLACAFRIFAKYGLDEGVAGHITVRDPGNHSHFWVNPFGVAFGLMTVSDLLLIDHKGKILEGGKPGRQIYNRAAYCIHAAIHAARPDVDAAAHSHSIYGRAFSTLGKTLDITNQDVCVFYKDHALYPDFGGVVITEEESMKIVEHLGKKKALILQNHGILTVGQTVEETVAWFIKLENACHVQLLADAAAQGTNCATIKISDESAEFTRDQIGSPHAGWFVGSPYFDMIDAETEGSYKV